MKDFNIDAAITGAQDFGLPFADNPYSARLAATTDTTLTVPGEQPLGVAGDSTTNKYLAVFSYAKAEAKDVWVALNAIADAPAGATFATDTSELNPTAKVVEAGDVLHFYAVTANTDVSVAFYRLKE